MDIKHKVLLIIRDGWGFSEKKEGNAIALGNTPNHDKFTSEFPTSLLTANGNAVGNPEGTQGGSEVGHLTIGAGRIVWQPYEMINQAIKNGSFFENEVLLEAINKAKENNSNLHINGLFSTEGIHADYRHMIALLKLCKQQDFTRVFVHLTLDGRDMPEKSALPILEDLEKNIEEIGVGQIVSVVGRYFAMDRDNNWDRTRKAYDLMVEGKGTHFHSAKEAIQSAYDSDVKSDYYIEPAVIVDEEDKPISLVQDGDSFIWYNFRSDRARQITAMMNNFDDVSEKPDKILQNLHYVCFSIYDADWDLPAAFPQQKVENNLAEVLAKNNLKQLRIAETEKYAHVTFFFNSQKDTPVEGEDRIMVDSPKVSSYDQKPEMSAYEVTEKLLPEIGKYEFIAVNYANPDLVGHSGSLEATIKAVEVVDECVGRVVEKALSENYVILLMADHGNAEVMIYPNGEPNPSHGENPVQLTLISNDEDLTQVELKDGGMSDIAPTILGIMGIEKPEEMTGKDLI